MPKIDWVIAYVRTDITDDCIVPDQGYFRNLWQQASLKEVTYLKDNSLIKVKLCIWQRHVNGLAIDVKAENLFVLKVRHPLHM